MKYTFAVAVKREIGTELIQSVSVDPLHINEHLTNADREFIKLIGLNTFLTNIILDKLEEKAEAGDLYEAPRQMDTVLKLITGSSAMNASATSLVADGIETQHVSVVVDYQINPNHQRCSCCEKITPWFVGSTIITEMLLNSMMRVLKMQYAQGDHGLIKMDSRTNLGISITSASLGLMWTLWEIFTGGEIVFLRDSGANMDRNFHRFYDWVTGNTRVIAPTLETPAGCSKATVATSALKTLFILGILNDVYENILGTYTHVTSLSQLIGKDVIFPQDVFQSLQWVQVGLDHLDDPFTYWSTIYFGFKIIDLIVAAKLAKKTSAHIEEETPELSAIEQENLIAARTSRAVRWNKTTSEKVILDMARSESKEEDITSAQNAANQSASLNGSSASPLLGFLARSSTPSRSSSMPASSYLPPKQGDNNSSVVARAPSP